MIACVLALVLLGGGGVGAYALLSSGGETVESVSGEQPGDTTPESERPVAKPASFKGEDLCAILPSDLLKRLVRNAQENPADDTSTMSSAESTCKWESGEQPQGKVEQKRDLEVVLTTYEKARDDFDAKQHYAIRQENTQAMPADPPEGFRFSEPRSVPGLGEASYAFTSTSTDSPTKSVDAEITFQLSGALVTVGYGGYDALPGLGAGYRKLSESQVMSSAQEAAKAISAALLKGEAPSDDGEVTRITAASRGRDVCEALSAEIVQKYVGKARTSARNTEYSDERWASCGWSSTFDPGGRSEVAYDMVDLRVNVATMDEGVAAARHEFRQRKKDATAVPAGVPQEQPAEKSRPIALTGIGEEAFAQLSTSDQIVNRREGSIVYRVGGQVVEVTFGGLSTVATTAGPDSGTTALSEEKVLTALKDIAKRLASRTTGK
ncbi:hypothetical protein E1286_21995 [Nonomuraea terrae]|uniref:DUF3558 domain-containing protein n=1 Tax=Nonomuraea terrae TaxID=2530383 RepID=A0A4R4YM16_9ACTN|nr:hypothetical protein [Nonomuraea terrae]TDD46078.1 hypothetical protein E1286_21995 [Nonomuraea terrae]